MNQPRVEELRLNWGLDPQAQQSLSVAQGTNKITSSINEMVNRKVEDDRQNDAQLLDIVKNTSGRYQDEIYKLIDQGKQKIKDVGKANWNSRELRNTRSEVLNQVMSASKKANYVSERVPQLLAAIKSDPYIEKDYAIKAINDELDKGVAAADVDKIESIMNNPAYRNMTAVMRDATNRWAGEDQFTSDPFVERKSGNVLTNQFNYKKNWKVEKDANGNVVMENSKPKLVSAIGNQEVKDILGMTGNADMAYQYFEKMFEAQDPRVKQSEGEERRKLVLSLAGDYINHVVGAPSVKNLSTRMEQPDYVARALAIQNAKGKEREMIQGQTIEAWTQSLMKGNPDPIINEVGNVLGVDGVVFAQWQGGKDDSRGQKKRAYYYDPKAGEVKHRSELPEDYFTYSKAADGSTISSIKPQYAKTWKPFTGLAYKVPVKQEASASRTNKGKNYRWVIKKADFNDRKSVYDMATSLFNEAYKQPAGYDPASQDPAVTTTGLPKAGDIDGNYRFMGGDPSDQNNWVLIK